MHCQKSRAANLCLVLLYCCIMMLAFCLPAWAWPGKVVAIIDGDSLVVRAKNKDHEIRLYGIDAPEFVQPSGKKAKHYLESTASGKVVTVLPLARDSYGRVVALVRRGNKLVNRELVKDGWAWVYSRYCRKEPLCSNLARLEGEARNQGLGLWQEQKPVAPWSWRRESDDNRQ